MLRHVCTKFLNFSIYSNTDCCMNSECMVSDFCFLISNELYGFMIGLLCEYFDRLTCYDCKCYAYFR
jgi:hypothetical protein